MLHCVNCALGREFFARIDYIHSMRNVSPTKPTMKVTGIVLIILGVLALLFPLTTGFTLNLFFGVVLAIAGATHFVGSYRAGEVRNRWGHLGLAAVFALIGLLLIFVPMIGIAAFTLLLALVFIIQGGVLIYTGIFSGKSWKHMALISGVVGVLAGILLLANWPASGNWIVGVLAGINLIVLGVAMLVSRFETASPPPDAQDVIDI